ncbi:SLC13 family permease [Candidatus Protochlamydia phocaeensis]|uniref:SLC13 family permease n=1 Tax=Candidatus Protochlamydia phocaeensis TaxID=1414722 RepID=UPI000838A4A1|nr:SLC13 family permease [Candidatus Protochlamydia phocaeensis]
MDALTPHAHWILTLFLLGYASIVLEEIIHINKTTTALFMAVACWTILFLEPGETTSQHLDLLQIQMFKVCQVLFFLWGALITVETVNAYGGFLIISRYLLVQSKILLLWMAGILAFFLSSVLDNLTTTIVMLSIIQKLLDKHEDRLLIGGAVVIAANAGGAWTPIGDVSTTVLWIGERVTTVPLVRDLFLPCFLSLIFFLFLNQFALRGSLATPKESLPSPKPYGVLVLILGVLGLIFVPIYKIMTDLPPFIGMMLTVAMLWLVTDFLAAIKPQLSLPRVTNVLPHIDVSIILFYLGLLLSIMALESAGLLQALALWLNSHIANPFIIVIAIGLASALVDNVSLVAATLGMYSLKTFGTDSEFWQLMSYCAGTGGSILIIGSAAGVALMALERATFGWYLRYITWKALATYAFGILIYFMMRSLFHPAVSA